MFYHKHVTKTVNPEAEFMIISRRRYKHSREAGGRLVEWRSERHLRHLPIILRGRDHHLHIAP